MSDIQVITGEVPWRYAEALIELALEGKSLPRTEKDMTTFRALLADNAPLQTMCANPTYAVSDKVDALVAVAVKAKLAKLSQDFIGTVAENGRAEDLMGIIAAFQALVARRKGEDIAYVGSAKALSAAQKKDIGAELHKALGRKIKMETRIDPDLLGGFVVQVGSQLFDYSLKSQIEDMKLTLKEV